MTWDKANLNGKVTVNDITETARKYIPEMRAKGADVFINLIMIFVVGILIVVLGTLIMMIKKKSDK